MHSFETALLSLLSLPDPALLLHRLQFFDFIYLFLIMTKFQCTREITFVDSELLINALKRGAVKESVGWGECSLCPLLAINNAAGLRVLLHVSRRPHIKRQLHQLESV